MTEKRFVIDEHSDVWKIDDNRTGDFYIIANSFDCHQLCNLLNRQELLIEAKREAVQFHVDGYNQLKQTIHEAYENERTQIGRNVLRQLLESLE